MLQYILEMQCNVNDKVMCNANLFSFVLSTIVFSCFIITINVIISWLVITPV